ncbi:1-acyl-sn-glycerol-3-phosphate acyltransferase beta-like [Rhodnius prolixus]
MISAFGIFNWECLLATVFLSILLLPFSSNKTIRYYGCYILYVVSVSTFGLLLLPIFLLRPKNVANLTLAAIPLKYFTKLLGIKWELKNGHILKESKGAVIVANHQSILDIMGMWNIWEIMGNCTVVAKKELLFVPPFGQLGWLAGLIFIDRNNPKRANEQIRSKYRLISEKGSKIWLFPEGTRNHNSENLLPFKKGAFRTAIECKAQIIPVVFSPYYFIDEKKKIFDKGRIIISTLEPIPVENYTFDNMDSLIQLTYEKMNSEYRKLREECKIGVNLNS